MSTAAHRARHRAPATSALAWDRAQQLSWAASDAMVITWRNLLHTVRVRELLIFVIVQPVILVLLFAYVFGGAIPLPGGGDYREFLMAGVFAQSVAFTTYPTAMGTAFDMQLGIMDRFRSLPMHPTAIFVGRTLGDLARTGLSIVVMAVCGLAVGWRIDAGFAAAVGGFALLALFGYAMSWAGAYIGFAGRSVEAVQGFGFIWLFPLVFVSNAFVPTANMPGWLQFVADWNPVSAVAASARELFGNPNPFADPDSFPAQHPVALSLLWSVAIVAVFALLCTRRFNRVAGR